MQLNYCLKSKRNRLSVTLNGLDLLQQSLQLHAACLNSPPKACLCRSLANSEGMWLLVLACEAGQSARLTRALLHLPDSSATTADLGCSEEGLVWQDAPILPQLPDTESVCHYESAKLSAHLQGRPSRFFLPPSKPTDGGRTSERIRRPELYPGRSSQ